MNENGGGGGGCAGVMTIAIGVFIALAIFAVIG